MPRFTSATIIAVPFSFRIVIAPATAERAADIRESLAAEIRLWPTNVPYTIAARQIPSGEAE